LTYFTKVQFKLKRRGSPKCHINFFCCFNSLLFEEKWRKRLVLHSFSQFKLKLNSLQLKLKHVSVLILLFKKYLNDLTECVHSNNMYFLRSEIKRGLKIRVYPDIYLWGEKVLFAHFSYFLWKKISEHFKEMSLSSKWSKIRKYFIKYNGKNPKSWKRHVIWSNCQNA